jgi:hypothetical protein
MDAQRKFLLLVDDKPAGPYTLSELSAMLAAGKITPATLFRLEGSAGWNPISDLDTAAPIAAAAAGIGSPRPAPRLPSETLKDLPSFGSELAAVILNRCLALLFIAGVALALYFAFVYDTTGNEIHNAGLLNNRLVGVIGGSALAIVACLLKILRVLQRKP